MKKILLSAIATMMALTASAQFASTDAQWCDVMQQALAEQGVQAQVRCDLRGSSRVLHVTTGGRTYNYTVPAQTLLPDYSSPVNIVMEGFEFHPSHRGDFRADYRGEARAWMGPHSSLYMPEEVFTVPADFELLEGAFRTALSRVQRVNLVDSRYAGGMMQSGEPLFALRTTVVALQRGELYAKDSGPKPPEAGKDNGGKPDRGKPGTRPAPRKVERKFAYAQLHLELIDCRTGSIVWSDDLRDDDNSSFSSTNPMENVVNHLTRSLTQQMQRLCPSVAPRAAVSGRVLRAEEENKNKTHTLYVDLGTAQQLEKGDVLSVYAVTMVAGHEGRELLGTVSVMNVQGPELTLCKVKKGEKEIYAALHAGATLVVDGALD